MIRIKTDPMAKSKSTISYIYSIKNKIDIAPPYQRQGGLWDPEKKQLFIDSIFNGYDIPKFYLHVMEKPRTAIDGKIVQYAIIDGKQRLETLWQFIENNLTLGDFEMNQLRDPISLEGKKYRDLAKEYPSLKAFFDNYELPIMCVKLAPGSEEELIEDMFSRLNEAVAINSAEKRNARGGKMVLLIREIAKHHLFTEKISFTNKRLQHQEVSARLLFLENCIKKEKIIDTKKKYLDGFVDEFHDKDPESAIYKTVKTTLDLMYDTFFSQDDLLKAQGRIPIYYLLFRQAKEQNKLQNISREKIMDFNSKVAANKKLAEQKGESASSVDFDLLTYHTQTIQGTNDAGSIKARFRIIAKDFKINPTDIYEM